VMSSATFLTLFFVTIRPNRSEYLKLEWNHPRTTSISGILDYSRLQAAALLQELPGPPRQERPAVTLVRRVLMISIPVCILCGIGLARGDAKKRGFLVFMCGCPLVTAFATDLFNIYPWRSRTLLLLLPCLVLLLGSCIEVVEDAVSRGFWQSRFIAIACVMGIGVTCWAGLRYGEGDLSDINENWAEAVRYIGEKASPSDFIFVHSYAEEAWKLYSRMYRLGSSLGVKFGDTGWPCCARGKKPGFSGKALVAQDLLSNIPESFDGRIWILATSKKFHWWYVGLDEPVFIRSLIISAGCQQVPVETFMNVSLQQFQCDGPALLKLRGH
jgi:hypothetical protein